MWLLTPFTIPKMLHESPPPQPSEEESPRVCSISSSFPSPHPKDIQVTLKPEERLTNQNPFWSSFSFLSWHRRPPLCTVSSRTRYFSPPTPSSQGHWATPRRPHSRSHSPRAHPAGSAGCPSQACSSHPDRGLAPELDTISFNQWTRGWPGGGETDLQ
jgi:hypothetical protein